MQARSIIVSQPTPLSECLIDEEFDSVENATSLRWALDIENDITIHGHGLFEESERFDATF